MKDDMNNKDWDVVVVGGGPAGMMAAGRAAERGLKVILIEKNDSLGQKLLITGGGRCNVTNAEFDNRKLLERFKDASQFLFSAFSQWAVKDTLNFFNSRGVPTKVEKEQRVFPESNSSKSIWNTLIDYIKNNKVTILSNSPVISLIQKDKKIEGVVLKNKKEIRGKSVIIATGGTSRPETGSSGDGYVWLKNIGHTVIKPTPSLVPLSIDEPWIKNLAGLTVSDVKISILQNSAKQDSKKGKILFTHVGVSGPTILNMSKDIGELLKYGDVTISIDLLTSYDYGKLNQKLQDIFKENDKKKFKNSLKDLVPGALSPIIVELSKIDPDKSCNSVSRDERLALVQLLKNLPIKVGGLLGVEKAIISSGGVILEEVDFKTMRSRLYPNLYLIGDILNIDRPSGGFSLQLCWTTGFVAGNSI